MAKHNTTVFRPTMNATVVASEDTGIPAWRCSADGDKEGPGILNEIKLAPDTFPLGTKLTIEIPHDSETGEELKVTPVEASLRGWTYL